MSLKGSLPVRVIPWIITANARSKEGVREGETRPIHSYSRLGQRLNGLMEKDGSIKVPKRPNFARKLKETAPVLTCADMEPEEERNAGINLSAYIADTEPSPVQLSHIHIMKRRYRAFLQKQLKRGLSMSMSKGNLEEDDVQPASSIYVFTGTSLPHRTPSACSLKQGIAVVRKRLSLGYTQSNEVPKLLMDTAPMPRAILAKGRRVRLRPKVRCR